MIIFRHYLLLSFTPTIMINSTRIRTGIYQLEYINPISTAELLQSRFDIQDMADEDKIEEYIVVFIMPNNLKMSDWKQRGQFDGAKQVARRSQHITFKHCVYVDVSLWIKSSIIMAHALPGLSIFGEHIYFTNSDYATNKLLEQLQAKVR